MRHLYLFLLLPALQASASTPLPQTGSGETDGYRLVWQELFDGESLDPQRWNIEVNGAGGGNNELQFYTDREDNVTLGDDGDGNRCLILTARREAYQGRSFTSGRVNSQKLTAFTHGKIEASIKLPVTANGLWPAFWMMGNDYQEVGWPRCGEIDILEMGNATGISAGTTDRYFNGAAHWGPQWPNASYANAVNKAYSLQDGEYHLYTLIWTPESLKMYVDLDKMPKQNPYYKLDITVTEPDNEWSAGNYFHKDNFILFNLAVGGDFTGIHKPDDITALHEGNGHEASMYVNYVRIYQKGEDHENLTAMTEGDPDLSSGVLAMRETAPLCLCDSVLKSSAGCAIDVFSMQGACVARSEQPSLDIAGLSEGIYIARSGDGVLKFIK